MNTSTLARTFKLSVLSAAIALVSLNASAALYDRGNGMIYDSTQNITWLQDANYAQTSGYDDDGMMTWYEATTWADGLFYGGFSDWRLSSARLNGLPNCSPGMGPIHCPGGFNGDQDYSMNNSRAEIGHLFFELGNWAIYDENGDNLYGGGWVNSSFIDPLLDTQISFINVQFSPYWELESYAIDSSKAWAFINDWGAQGYGDKTLLSYVWAVRDGDVLPVNEVPVPAAAWLLGSGLIGLAGLARRKK